ncbi:MAG: asparagine synthase (glutamine-hydrolyzing) [Gemmatimonadota bacterium]
MCGFAGVFLGDTRVGGGAQAHAERMAATLVHRGPDDSGSWGSPCQRVGFGFRRLSIVELSELGHQPMTSPSGRFTMVFNGEVYNYREIRDALPGRTFRGGSDTEVILAAIEEWGLVAAVERFVGMFAIALWDQEEQRLHLVRDRLGLKPLYYFSDGAVLAFGSELKAVVEAPGFEREVDREALEVYLRYLYVPAPLTIYRRTRKLLPGHILSIDAPHPVPESREYWSPPSARASAEGEPFTGTEEEAADQLEELLRESVRLRLRADVPLGAFLSAGVDSSTVVSLMQEASSRPVRTFSVAFEVAEHNEADVAAEIAGHLGTDHTELLMTGDEALAVVSRLPEIFDEPHADTSQIPQYLLCSKARAEVTVALSGDGGDEVFGGYHRYIDGVGLIGRLQGIPRPARRVAAGGISALSPDSWDRLFRLAGPLLPSSARRRLPGEKLAKLARLLPGESEEEMYADLVSGWPGDSKLVLGGTGRPGRLSRIMRESSGPLLDRMMLADQMVYLPDDQLAKVDRTSMAVSLEVRVPMVDHRLVEFSWRLPHELKVRDGVGKYLLRKVLYRHVPSGLVERPKMGLSVPLAEWLQGPLRGWAEDLLDRRKLSEDGFLDPEVVHRAWARLLGGRREAALGMWAVLQFQAWRRRWLPG